MAIDKSRTPTWMKVVLVLIALMLFLSVGGIATAGLFSGGCANTAQNTTGTSSEDASAAIAAIQSQYSAQAQAAETELTKSPKDYDLLVAQANTYHDWAGALITSAQQSQDTSVQAEYAAAAQPVMLKAVEYYERALKVKPGDPNVETDLAIMRFYSGDSEGAIKQAITVIKANPGFAPAHYNLGIFYAQTEQPAAAVSSLEKYLSLEPTGTLAATAQELLDQVKAKVKSQTATGTP